MSLKDLVKLVKKGTIQQANTATNNTRTATIALDYDIQHRTPKEADLLLMLEQMADIIRQSGTLKEADKKRFILTFFRLAFSQDARATGCFHPSEISTEDTLCHRKMYYQKGNVRKDATYVNFTADNRMMRLVDLGTMLHLYIQENLDRLGVLKDFEVPVDAPQFGISGKMDGIIEFVGNDDLGVYYDLEDMVLEVKSINDYGFTSLRKAKPEHLKQASIYGGLLGLKRICFLYYNKNTSAHKIFVHDVDFKYLEGFKETAGSIIQLFNNNVRKLRTNDVKLHDGLIPKRICQNRTTKRAMDCAFADYCFKMSN